MKSRVAFVLVLAVTATVLSGCSKIEEAVQPEPTVVTKEATVSVAGASVDGDFPVGAPESLPLWPGSTITAGEVKDGTVSVTLETTSSYTDVVAGTTVGFERAGWSVAEAGEEASATVLNVSGDDYEGILTLTQTDSGVTIDYLLTESSE